MATINPLQAGPETVQARRDWDEVKENDRSIKYRPKKHRWILKPSIPECWRGDYQEWHIEADNYQRQLYCGKFETWINPGGNTCELCERRLWPSMENARRNIEIMLAEQTKEAAEDAVVSWMINGSITELEALTLACEYLTD